MSSTTTEAHSEPGVGKEVEEWRVMYQSARKGREIMDLVLIEGSRANATVIVVAEPV